MEFFQTLAGALFGSYSVDCEEVPVNLNAGAQSAGHSQGTFVVSTGGVAAKVGSSIGQGGGNDSPLGKALGRGHREGSTA